MLVLSRKKFEQIVIVVPLGFSGEIEVAVADVRGDKVRLGIEADKSVQVHRKEVWDAIRGEMSAGCDNCCHLKGVALVAPIVCQGCGKKWKACA